MIKEATDARLVPSSEEHKAWVNDQLMNFNRQFIPTGPDEYIIPLSFHYRSESDEIIAGVNAVLIAKSTACVSILWVHEEHRHGGYGSLLLSKVEEEARQRGAYMIYLDTLDFQAKGFYLKHGYALFGQLDDSPAPGHTRFYLRKKL